MITEKILNEIKITIEEIINEKIIISEDLLLRSAEEGKESLMLSSLDFIEVIIKLELKYNIEIPIEETPNIKSVKDLGNLIYSLVEIS